MSIKRLVAAITVFVMLAASMPMQAWATMVAPLEVAAEENKLEEIDTRVNAEERAAPGERRMMPSQTMVLGTSTNLTAQGGSENGDHVWESEDSAIVSINGTGLTAAITAEEVGTTNIIHRYRENSSDNWNEEVWKITSNGISAKFYISKLIGKPSGVSELEFYPSPGDPITIDGVQYDYLTGLPGFLTENGRQKAPRVGNRYSVPIEGEGLLDKNLIRELKREILDAIYEKLNLQANQKIVWYSIVYSRNGYHVDGYETDIPVSATYSMNPPDDQPNREYNDAKAQASGKYLVLTPDNCGFTVPKRYRFVGWKVNADDHVYQPGETLSLSGETTFTAQWEKIPEPPANEGGASDYVVVETPEPVEPDAAIQGTATVKVYRDGTYLADQSFSIQFAGQSANIRFSARDTVSGEQIGTDYVLSSAAVMRAEGTQPDTEIEQIDYMGLGTVTRLHDGDTLYLLYSSTFTVNGTVEIDGNAVDFERIRKENSDQKRRFIDWLNRRYVMNYGLGTGTAAIVYGGAPTDSRLIAKDTQPPFDTDVDLRSGQLLTEVTIGSKTYTLEEKKLQIRSGDSYETVLPGAEEEHINLDQSDYLKKRSGDLRVIETAMAHDFVFDLKIQARPKAETFTLYAGFADDGAGLSAQQLDEYAKDGVHIQPGWEQLDLVKGQPHSVEWIAPDGYVITGYQENATAQVTSLLHDNQGVARFSYDTTGTDEAAIYVTAYLAADQNRDLVPDTAQVRFTYQSADQSKGNLIGNMDESVNKQDGAAYPHAIPQPVTQTGYVFAYWQADGLTDPDIAMGTFRATAYTKDTVFTAHFVPDRNHDGIADERQVFVRYVSADTECGTVQGTEQIINLDGATQWTQVETVPAEAQAKDGYVFDHGTVDYGDRMDKYWAFRLSIRLQVERSSPLHHISDPSKSIS